MSAAGGPRASTGLHWHGRPLRLRVPVGYGARSTDSQAPPLLGPTLSIPSPSRLGGCPPAWSGSGPPGLVSGRRVSLRLRFRRRRSLTPSRTQARRAGYVRDSDTAPKLQVTSLIGHCHLEPDSCTLMAQKESVCSKKSSCTRVMCWRRRRDSKSCLNGYKSPKCAALCRTTTSHVGCASRLGCCLQRVPEQARRRMARKPKGRTDRWLTSDVGSFASWAGWTKARRSGGSRFSHSSARLKQTRRVDPHARRQSRTRCSLARTLDPRMRDAERA